MAVVTAKELIRKLRATGTGEAKLNIGREVLMANVKASADAVVAAYKRAFENGEIADLTWEKVQTIAMTGEWVNPASVRAGNIEDEEDEVPSAVYTPTPTPSAPVSPPAPPAPPSGPSGVSSKGASKAKGDDFSDVK